MRRAAKRDASEKAIVDALRASGWSVDHLSIPDGPDLVAGKDGMTYLIECKTGKKKLRDGQAKWHQAWRGGPVLVLRSVDDAHYVDFLVDKHRAGMAAEAAAANKASGPERETT